MNRLRSLALLAVLLILSFAWTGVVPVQAHAMLLRSVPDANASLATAPAKVDLYFSEAIDPNMCKITVMDTKGMSMDSGAAQIDPADTTHLSVVLQPLPDGVYMVSWSVISATDGHQTSGSFPFGVGKVNQSALAVMPTTSSGSSVPLADALTKGLLYIAAAAIMGKLLFTFLVWNPSTRQNGIDAAIASRYSAFSAKLALGSLIVAGVAEIFNILSQAGPVTDSIFALPWQPTFITFLLSSRLGVIGIARLGMVIIMLGLLLPPRNRWNRWSALGVNLLFLLTFSLESHAAAAPAPLLPVTADWIHMVAVSVWVGGLFSFLGAMLLIRKLPSEALAMGSASRLTANLIPHFSNLALTSVGILTLTGIYSALMHIGTFEALITTPYGQAFILKGVIGFGMVGLGAYNFLITTPNMRRAAAQPGGNPKLVGRFSRLLLGEASLGILILIWVAVFTSLSPARVLPASTGFTNSTQVDDLTVTLNINPNKPGMNTFTATVKSGNQPVVNTQSVSLEFTALSGMVPPSKAAMTNNNNGTYTLQGGYLGMPDQWDVKVVVVRQGKFDAYAGFTVDTTSQATAPTMPWRTLAAGMIVMTGAGYAFSFKMLGSNLQRWLGFGFLPGLALGAIGVWVGIL